LTAVVLAGLVIVALDVLDILPLFDSQDNGVFMPTLDGDPKISPEGAEEYKRILLQVLKDGEDITPLYMSTVPEIDFSRLKLKPSSVIADIGCGTGALEVALLERRMPFARIYAVDIHKRSLEFLEYVIEASRLEGREKITTVHSDYHDVKLPPASIDIVLLHNTRIGMREGSPLQGEQLRQRDRLMVSIKEALRPGARVHVYEPTYTTGEIPRPFPEENVSEPYLAHGFKQLSKERLLLGDEPLYYMIFELKD